jgi:GNAT superfamily N-acetyltransferase
VGLVVSTATKRGGIGRALVTDAERWALGQGFDSITVRSNVARTESHPFYERLGYVRRKTQHAYSKSFGVTN